MQRLTRTVRDCLARCKRKQNQRAWRCDYSTAVFCQQAKPEAMVKCWIEANGSRPGYVRLQTTRPTTERLPPVPAVAVTALAAHAPRPPLSTVIAVLGGEIEHVSNLLGQLESFKDALSCVCDVAHTVEILLGYLKQIEGEGREAAALGGAPAGGAATSILRQHLSALPSASSGSCPALEMAGRFRSLLSLLPPALITAPLFHPLQVDIVCLSRWAAALLTCADCLLLPFLHPGSS